MALITPGGSGGAAFSGAASKVSLTGGNITTTSATFVDATGLTATLATGARRCLVVFSGTVTCNNAGSPLSFDIAVDGTRQGGTLGLFDINVATISFDYNGSFTFVTDVLTAASHTIKLQFRSDGTHTATIFATTTSPAVFSVLELPITS